MEESFMMHEIRSQPGSLRQTAERVNAFLADNPLRVADGGRLILTGCGDMDFSARAAAGLIRRASSKAAAPVRALSSMEMRWEAERITPRDLVIAASFSGRTPRTMEAARLARRAGARLVAVTGNSDSSFAREADQVVSLCTGSSDRLENHEYAGYHYNVPQTVTYLAALHAELMLAAEAAAPGGDLRSSFSRIPDLVERQLERQPREVGEWVSRSIDGRRGVAILGSGPWRPAAMYGAAKFLEMSIPSLHQCIEEFNHLEIFLAGSETLVVFLCPDESSASRARELAGPYGELGSGRLIVGKQGSSPVRDDHDPGFLPIEGESEAELFVSTILTLQLLAERIGPALGRDINRWVGGVRTELIEKLSQITIRSSQIAADRL